MFKTVCYRSITLIFKLTKMYIFGLWRESTLKLTFAMYIHFTCMCTFVKISFSNEIKTNCFINHKYFLHSFFTTHSNNFLISLIWYVSYSLNFYLICIINKRITNYTVLWCCFTVGDNDPTDEPSPSSTVSRSHWHILSNQWLFRFDFSVIGLCRYQ